MNAFAKPEDAMPYTYTDFPAPERAKMDLSFADNPSARKFIPFDASQCTIESTPLPTVQGAVLQDFKEVLTKLS